jgi:cytidylate kinase
MNIEPGFEKCLTFIHCQLHPANAVVPPAPTKPWRAVTISRQAGSGGHAVAEVLVGELQAYKITEASPWMVFDRNLVEKVLEDHHLPPRLARFMPEDRVTEIDDVIDEVWGLHPPSSTLVDKTAETILRLAERGNVILLGRGGNVITSKLDYVFHVRLVGSLEKRAEYIQKIQRLSRKAALEFIDHEDLGRRRYLKKYYHKEIDDPLLYHLVINTDLIGPQQAAGLIVQTMLASRTSYALRGQRSRLYCGG